MGGIALDLGTSAIKAVRFDAHGVVVSTSLRSIETTGRNGRREQDPDAWWAAASTLLAEMAAETEIHSIALAGTMQNLVPMGAHGAAAGPAILYNDARIDGLRRAELERRLPSDLAARVGNSPANAWPLFKLMDGGAGTADRWHFGAKDVLIERLTGARVIDPTVASTTGLMRLAARDWDDELLAAAGLGRKAVPPIVAGDQIVGETRGGDGVPAGVPVVCGAGDAGAATWGAGAEAAGAAHAYVGTTGWMATTLAATPVDLPRDTYVLAMPTGAAALQIAPMISAGAALDWAAGATGSDIEEAFAAIGTRCVAATSPLFLPYLAGERSPFEDRDVRGAWANLDAAHTADDLFLAAVEGVAHALRHCMEAMGEPPEQVTAIGGGFRHPAMARVAADALGVPLTVAPHPLEATAFGAWRLAQRALGRPDTAIEAANGVHLPASAGAREQALWRWRAYRKLATALREVGGILAGGPERADDPPR